MSGVRASCPTQDSIEISFGAPLRKYALADILPQRFGPGDLLHDADVPLLLQPQAHALELDFMTSPPPPAAASADAAAGAGGAVAQKLRRRAAEVALAAARQVRVRCARFCPGPSSLSGLHHRAGCNARCCSSTEWLQ